MQLLYSGRIICSNTTLKRLLLLADEVGFVDRPSIVFPNWGTIGVDSPIRRCDPSIFPIKISAFRPPSGPISDLYLKYIEADLKNTKFIKTFLVGLEDDDFAWRFIQPECNYDGILGKEIRNALILDKALAHKTYSLPTEEEVRHKISTHEERIGTLKIMLIEASVLITSTTFISSKTQFEPVTDNNFYSLLLSERLNEALVNSHEAQIASELGLAIISTVLPDDLLQKIDFDSIGEYRENTKKQHKHYMDEINCLVRKIEGIDILSAKEEIKKIIVTDVEPKIREYYQCMEYERDKQFGNAIKTIAKWEFPTISIGCLASLNWQQIMIASATVLLPAIISHLTDYLVETSNIKRRNAMSYLIGLSSNK